MGGADYVDQLLGAFSFDPPRIWAGGPFSGRHGGEAGFDQWLELGALEELAWRTRIEGSQGRPEREFNGPVVGWQAALPRRAGRPGRRLRRPRRRRTPGRAWPTRPTPTFRELLFEHACEALYGDPVYGGNRDGAAWAAIGFDGDVQPRGWTDDEVDPSPPMSRTIATATRVIVAIGPGRARPSADRC